MVKNRKSFWIYIIIAIIIVVGGILIYNSLKEKESGWVVPSDEREGTEEKGGEMPSTGEETGIISKIKNLFNIGDSDSDSIGSSGAGSGGGSGGGAGGNGASGGETEYTTDQTICQNAQNDDLCDGLDLIYGEGYRTMCCSEHNLCC